MTDQMEAGAGRPLDKRARLLIGLGIALLGLVLMAPALAFHRPLDGHDGYIQHVWQQLYGEQFWSGDLYPRWLRDMNLGLGSPAFFFYPPLGHAVTALLYPLAPGGEHVLARLAIGATLAQILGGLGMWSWMRAIRLSPASAALAAVIYMLGPYHLFVDTYLRTAFAELWAFAWAPWAFLGLSRVERWSGFLTATLCMAMVVLSHLPSALFLLPAFGLYILLRLRRSADWPIGATALAAALSALALCGPYLGAALTQTQLVDQTVLFGGRHEPRLWLIGPGQTGDVVMKVVTITIAIQVLLLAVSLGLWAARRPQGALAYPVVYALLVGGVTTLLMSQFALPLWQMGTVLDAIQFPWRMMLLHTLVTAVAVAYGVEALPKGTWTWRLGLVAVPAMLAIVNSGLYAVRARANLADHRRELTPAALFEDYRDAPEYRRGDMWATAALFRGRAARTVVLGGQGRVDIKRWNPRDLEVSIQATTPVRVGVRQYNYPGWSYRVDKGSWRPAESIAPATPALAFKAPAGAHAIELRLRPQTGETVGWVIGAGGLAVTLLTAGGLWAVQRRRARPV